MGSFENLSEGEHIAIGTLALLAAIVYIVLFVCSIFNAKALCSRQRFGCRLLFTQFIIFAIEILRFLMNLSLVIHSVTHIVHPESQTTEAGKKLLNMFNITLVSSQFCSIIFAFNQCSHLMRYMMMNRKLHEPEHDTKFNEYEKRAQTIFIVAVSVVALFMVTFLAFEISYFEEPDHQ